MCGNCLICLQRFQSEDSSCAVSSPAAHASARHKVIDTANARINVCLPWWFSPPGMVEGGSLVECNGVQVTEVVSLAPVCCGIFHCVFVAFRYKAPS